jgi:hypothetical protein
MAAELCVAVRLPEPIVMGDESMSPAARDAWEVAAPALPALLEGAPADVVVFISGEHEKSRVLVASREGVREALASLYPDVAASLATPAPPPRRWVVIIDRERVATWFRLRLIPQSRGGAA